MLTVDPLADVFDLTRVSCGVMAQLIAYEPWGVTIDPLPGAAFHAVVAGSCWLRVPRRPPQHMMPGDVVLLPTNTPHELVSSVDARTESLARFETDIPRTPDGDVVRPGRASSSLPRGTLFNRRKWGTFRPALTALAVSHGSTRRRHRTRGREAISTIVPASLQSR